MSNRNIYQKADFRTRQAKAKGYPARSIFKLEEIEKKHKLFKGGNQVVDLGAAPGSWSMYAAQRVGASGRVLAIDLKRIEQNLGSNVTTVCGDALDPSSLPLLSHGPYDVVISDMAPNTSGNKSLDQLRSFTLVESAIEVALALAKQGSNFVAKIFMSGDFPEAKKRLAAAYTSVKTVKPEGTRKNSTEVFLVGLDKKEHGTSLDENGRYLPEVLAALASLPDTAVPEET